MTRRAVALTVAVAVLAGLGASVRAQDKDTWKTAIRRLADAKEEEKTERVAAVKAVGDATFSDVDERTVRLILDFLGAELKRSQGGRTEEKVSQEVLDACTEALKKIQAPDAIKYMVRRAASGPDSRYGYHIVSALTGSKGGDFHEDLVKLVDHRTLLVQEAAIEALIQEGRASSLDIFIRVVADAERSFEVKIAALEGVKKLLKADDEANIDRLVEAMGRIPDSQRRVAVEIRDLLNGLLGMNEPSYDPNGWRSALTAKRRGSGGGGAPVVAGGQGGGAPSKGHMTTAEFFGIKSDSTRIIFCLDRTESMLDPCGDRKDEKKEPEREGVATGTGTSGRDAKLRDDARKIKKSYDNREITTKMDAVKREYINCVYNLDGSVRFTTIWYNTE
ncbi:MAG: HEAT repeat domain-containing protein, partial [Planctomycetota bacterium]